MLHKIPKPQSAYGELYKDKKILVGADLKTIDPEAQKTLWGDVEHLASLGIDVHVVSDIASSFAADVNEVVLINGSKGVPYRKDGRDVCAPVLLSTEVDAILQNEHPRIKVADNIKTILQTVQGLIAKAGKIAITGPEGLAKEMLYWRGSGTLCVDENQLQFSASTKLEQDIFEDIYAEHASTGDFRERTPDEIQELKEYLYTLRVKGSPLSGLSLIPDGEWTEISTLWSGYPGGGHIGKKAVDEARKLVENQGKNNIFALTLGAHQTFHSAGFQNLGSVSTLQSSLSQAELPHKVLTYSTCVNDGSDGAKPRDPTVFVCRAA